MLLHKAYILAKLTAALTRTISVWVCAADKAHTHTEIQHLKS